MKRYIKSTTRKELMNWNADIRKRQNALMQQYGVSYYNAIPADARAELDREDETHSAIEMIHSILTYGGGTAERVASNSRMKEYVDSLGYDTVLNLCQQEIDEFSTATIRRGIPGFDGGFYNSVKFRDDE